MSDDVLPVWQRIAPPLVVVALCCIAGAVLHHLLQRAYIFIDLDVYRWGGAHVRDAGSLYDLASPGTNLQFTYPPFAALVFDVLGKIGLLHRWTFSVVSTVTICRSAWILAARRGSLFRAHPTWLVAAGFAALGLIVEPGSQNIILGQVSYILTWLVLEALLGAWRARPAGAVAIGIAAAIKLTPALFIVWLLVQRRWRAAAAGATAFVAASGLAWLIVPTDSHDFWLGGGLSARRVGNAEYLPNQSINGVLWRLAGHGGIPWLWAALSVVTVVACCWVARRGSEVTAVGLIGLASVLVAPISWTHHWVIVLPLLVGLAGASPHRFRTHVRIFVALGLLALASRIVWHAPQGNHAEFHLDAWHQLISSTYVLGGLVLLACAALSGTSASHSDTATEAT